MGLLFFVGAAVAAPVLAPAVGAGIATGITAGTLLKAGVAAGGAALAGYYAYKGYRQAVAFAKRSRELFKPGGPLNPLPFKKPAPGMPGWEPQPKPPRKGWEKVIYFGSQILDIIRKILAPLSF